MTTNLPDDSHFRQVLHAIQNDRLVPFFGAGVNLAGRPLVPDGSSAPKLAAWTPGQHFLPSRTERTIRLSTFCGSTRSITAVG